MVLKSIGQVFGFGPNNQRNVNLNKETENLTPEFSNLKQIGRCSAEMILLFTYNISNIWHVQDIGLLRSI